MRTKRNWLLVLLALGMLAMIAVPVLAQDELKTTGVIEAIDGSTLTVNGVDYDTSSAEIKSTGPLSVGDTVKIVYVVEDGVNVAIKVKEQLDDDEDDDEVEEFTVTGEIEAVGGATLTVDGADYDTAAAVIVSIDDLSVGDTVTITYFVEDEANIALTVVEHEPESEVFTVTGIVDDFGDDRLVVDGVTYDTSDALIVSIEGLDDGDTVTVTYIVEDGVNIALIVIEVDEDDDDDDDDDDGQAPEHSRQYGVGVKCEPERPDGWVSYTVDEDDTLWSLAVATNTTIAALKFPNCIKNPHDISEGDEIFLPFEPDDEDQPEHPGRGKKKNKNSDEDDDTTEATQRGNGQAKDKKDKPNGNGNGGNGRGNGRGNRP